MGLMTSKKTMVAYLATICFAILCVAYFTVIGDVATYPEDALWNRPGNIHDHFVYANYGLTNDNIRFTLLDNNYGMYWIYRSFSPPEKQLYAHLVNLIFIIISASSYFRICQHFNLPLSSYMTFFLNTSILYFSILINKDVISISIFLISTLLALKKRYFLLLLLLIPAFVVRQQLVFFVSALLASSLLISLTRRVGLVRVSTISVGILATASIAGAIALREGSFVSMATLAGGVTGRLMEIATASPAIAPLTVPARLLLYIYDMYSSFFFFRSGVIDVAQALRIPALIYLLINLPNFLKFKSIRSCTRNSSFSILFIAQVSAFSCILLNPQINGRYFTILLPLVILSVTCFRNRRRWLGSRES